MKPSRPRPGLLPRVFLLLPLAALLGGCDMVVLSPAGDVAQQQGNLILLSTGLMLIIILPVMFLTCWFAWRYRAAHKARYEPNWSHSAGLELVIWAVPLLIIICLGAVTWSSTHLLDPYRPLNRLAKGQPVPADARPLEVQVVALDWKWLFILPEQGVATVNELAVPVDRQLRFRISSSSVMNSFYVPALAGQIYAMPGMETKLHGVINRPGRYVGFSANYSGAGFSGMRFAFIGADEAGFETWVQEARAAGGTLDRAAYLELERPSEREPVRRYANVEEGLFGAVVNMCVEPGKMCMHDMMAIDAKGGLGMAGIANMASLSHDRHARRGTAIPAPAEMVASICTIPADAPMVAWARPVDQTPLRGLNLARPGQTMSLPMAALPPLPPPQPKS